MFVCVYVRYSILTFEFLLKKFLNKLSGEKYWSGSLMGKFT